MKRAKDIDYKIISELLKNSKVSDRELGKKLGVSQPTISRRRTTLEKELIDGYTIVPKWDKLGYEILAVNFVKIKPAVATEEKYQISRERGLKWLMSQPNIIMTAASRGMGMDAFNISLHKSYSDYDEWFHNFRLTWGDLVDDIQSVLVNLRGKEVIKPLNFKYLSEAK
jgi:DNA-binding Lrp family transcriptional regulator